MFTKNHPEGRYVNGTLGEVTAFDDDGAPIIETTDGRNLVPSATEWILSDGFTTLAKIAQLPLRLAWAMTVHKSQGMTLDAATIDLRHAFEYGQGYVALSRVRRAKDLFLVGWNDRSLRVHPNILASDAEFRRLSAKAQTSCESRTKEDQLRSQRNFIFVCGGRFEETPEVTEPVKAKKIKKTKSKK